MKTLRIYLLISIFLPVVANACWFPPYDSQNELIYRLFPTINEYYYYGDASISCLQAKFDYQEENVSLWYKQLEEKLPESEINLYLYTDKSLPEKYDAALEDFFSYLRLCRRIQSIRETVSNPWYYPSSRGRKEELGVIEDCLYKCLKNIGGKYSERYVLQAMRCYNFAHCYDEARNLFIEQKPKMRENCVLNMAKREYAKSLYKTGHNKEAIAIYAQMGDIRSLRMLHRISPVEEMEFVYEHCPDSPYFAEELQVLLTHYDNHYLQKLSNSYFWDEAEGRKQKREETQTLNKAISLCRKVIRERKVKDPSIWYYSLACFLDAKEKPNEALTVLSAGIKRKKSAFLDDSYKVLRMYLEAQVLPLNSNYEARLLKDLKWICEKADQHMSDQSHSWYDEDRLSVHDYFAQLTNYEVSDSYFWNDAMRRIFISILAKRYCDRGNTTRALQLVNFADNRMFMVVGNNNVHQRNPMFNYHDFSNSIFSLVETMNADQIVSYFNKSVNAKTKFDKYLSRYSYLSEPYWADIIGTRYMAEHNYEKAVKWLERMGKSYFNKVNYTGYFTRDPFNMLFKNNHSERKAIRSGVDYKLNYAKEMHQLEKAIIGSKRGTEKGELIVRYATGYINQVNHCWTLTRFCDKYDYYNEENIDREWTDSHTRDIVKRVSKDTKRGYQMIEKGIAMMTDKQKKAEYLLVLGKYKRVLDECPDTDVAQQIRLKCDQWRDYARR